MTKRRTKPDETKGDNYGRWAVLTDCREPDPYRELWCGVIWQAILNVRFQVPNWQSSLIFLKRGGNFDWICSQLDMDAERTSKQALKALKIYKH